VFKLDAPNASFLRANSADAPLTRDRFENWAARVLHKLTCTLVLGTLLPALALAQSGTYPAPGSAPGAPQNPTVPTTVTQVISGCR